MAAAHRLDDGKLNDQDYVYMGQNGNVNKTISASGQQRHEIIDHTEIVHSLDNAIQPHATDRPNASITA